MLISLIYTSIDLAYSYIMRACSLNVQLQDMIKDYGTLQRHRDRQGETCQETKSLKSRMKKKRSRMAVLAGQIDAWQSLLGSKVTTAQSKLDSWIKDGNLPLDGSPQLQVGRLLYMAANEVMRAEEERKRIQVEAKRHLVWNDYMARSALRALAEEKLKGCIQLDLLKPDACIAAVVCACAAAPVSIGRQLWLTKNIEMLRRMKSRMVAVMSKMIIDPATDSS